ncbi:glutamate receptor ionotropic, kainate glr-3 [Dermacentor silvarum]|nr:glutamate receptor ionotropic, kainate glr-3 [Dermacentor silvarum]
MALNTTQLRVTVAAAPPWVQPEYKGEKLHVAGIFGHILQALADFVPFSFHVTYDPQRSFGTRLDNGSYTGIIGLLQTGEVDLAASSVFLQSDRAEVVTYAPVMYTSHCALIAVAGKPSVNAFGYLLVFDWQAWVVIVAMVPLMSAGLAYVERRRPRNRDSFFREAYDNVWDILCSFAYKGHTAHTDSYAGRLLLSFWWLAVLVLTNEFAGHLMASIAIKSEPPRFRSVEDVAYQTSIRPLIWKDTAFDAYVRTSEKPSLRALTSLALRQDGFVPLSELYSQGSLEQLYSGRAVLINDRDGSMHMLAKHCRLTGGRLYVAPELLFTSFSTMAYSKRLPAELQKRIQAKMRAIMESGLRLEWYNEGVKEWHRCRDMQRSGASKAGVLSFEELSYDDMAAIFFLWGIMATFALVVFLLEMCFYTMMTQHNCVLPRIAPRRQSHRHPAHHLSHAFKKSWLIINKDRT